LLKKVKRRYLAAMIDARAGLSSSDFLDAVWGAVLKLHGECGASRTGLSLISYDDEEMFAVLRVGHDAVDMVRAALASITSIAGGPAAVHVLRVSGTLKALREKVRR
jgi:ribonuclease P/MRP protein subunit POP5